MRGPAGNALGALVTIELGAAIVATLLIGRPDKLPGAALDSALVFHGYRAMALFIGAYVVTVLLYRSFEGNVASKVGTAGLEWGSGEPGKVAAEQMTKLNLRLDDQATFIATVLARASDEGAKHRALENSLQKLDREMQYMKTRIVDLERRNP